MNRRLGKRLAALLLAVLVCSVAAADDGSSQAADYALGEAAWQRDDYTTALAHWLPLADDGHARAQFAVGLAHERGQGVEQSAAAAARWYRRAAAQGLADAEYNLALLYLDGRGVGQDLEETVRLFRAAAERGHLPAQVNLAYSYEQGSGIEQDLPVAAAWYARAAMAGNREAWSRFTDLREAGVRPAVLPALPEPAQEPSQQPSQEPSQEPSQQPPAPEAKAVATAGVTAEPENAAETAAAAAEPPPEDVVAPAAAPPAGAAVSRLAASPRLRLAAYREPANAERGWRTLVARHGAVLEGLRYELVPAELGERGSFLRLEAGPFDSLAAARAACAAIREGGDDCLAIGP